MRVDRLPVDTGISGWEAIVPGSAPAVPLESSLNADHLIIGAGFAGMAAARRLTQLQPEARIILLDAKRIAEGPAGRNSGFMIDLPHELSSSDYATTRDKDLQQIALNRAAIAFAREAAKEYGMPTEAFDPCGKVNGAASERACQFNETYATHLTDLEEPFQKLDAAAMKKLTGSDFYQSGIYTPGTVMLQPVLFMRGMADGIRNRISIFEESPVLSLSKHGSQWSAETPKGTVEAKNVILTTNGHIESFGFFKREVFHVMLYASMTRELSDGEAAQTGEKRWGITPSDPAATTMRKISGTGGTRIITRNQMTYAPELQTNRSTVAKMGQRHRTAFARRYPHLAHVEQEYVWAGRLCLSRNSAPAFGKLEDGLFSACCQNGLGTARGTAMGMAVAELIVDGETDLVRAIRDQGVPKKLPPAPLDTLGANAFMRWGEFKARREL